MIAWYFHIIHNTIIYCIACSFSSAEFCGLCLDAPQTANLTLTSRTHSRVSNLINTSVCTIDREHDCGPPNCFPAQDLIYLTGHRPCFLFFQGILCSAAVNSCRMTESGSNVYSKALHNLCSKPVEISHYTFKR